MSILNRSKGPRVQHFGVPSADHVSTVRSRAAGTSCIQLIQHRERNLHRTHLRRDKEPRTRSPLNAKFTRRAHSQPSRVSCRSTYRSLQPQTSDLHIVVYRLGFSKFGRLKGTSGPKDVRLLSRMPLLMQTLRVAAEKVGATTS